MAFHGLKINKTESPDKTPYTVYYPHTIEVQARKWSMDYLQFVSIDPARKNYALRIERRYHNGRIIPIVFDKVAIASNKEEAGVMICETYQNLTNFLNKYRTFYEECHYIVIERQLPQNYQASRIAQHSISYFSLLLANTPLLPAIIEVDPKLKGKILGAPKGINDKQLKSWAVETARKLLVLRKDDYSLGVLDHFGNKQDDLSDTICQIEALIIAWGLPPTPATPSTSSTTLTSLTGPAPLSTSIPPTTLNILSQTLASQLVRPIQPVQPVQSVQSVQLSTMNNVVRTKKPNLIMMVDNAPKRN